MLLPELEDALNEQLNKELYSAYLYLAMSSYFESINLVGFASWMRAQSKEEVEHSMKYYDFLFSRGSSVELKTVDAPPSTWDSPLSAFEDAYRHEQDVTKDINQIVDLSIQKSDHATNNFLQWFVAEQVEEEASTSAIVEKLKMIGDEQAALVMVDRELSARVDVA